jgi:hypothetical protein
MYFPTTPWERAAMIAYNREERKEYDLDPLLVEDLEDAERRLSQAEADFAEAALRFRRAVLAAQDRSS